LLEKLTVGLKIFTYKYYRTKRAGIFEGVV